MRLADLGVVDAKAEALLHRSERARADINATAIQPRHGHAEALTLGPHPRTHMRRARETQTHSRDNYAHIGCWDLDVIKYDLASRLHFPAHFLLIRSEAHSGGIFGHQEAAHSYQPLLLLCIELLLYAPFGPFPPVLAITT